MGIWESLFGSRKTDPDVSASADDSAEAERWGESLRSGENWLELSAVFNSTDYSAAANKWERQQVAKRILVDAGLRAQDAILRHLTPDAVGLSELVDVLTQVGDVRAAEPLARLFPQLGPHGGSQARIVWFLAKYPSRKIATRLSGYLRHDYAPTRLEAAHGLGLLAFEETIPNLNAAFARDGATVREGLKRADTEFARQILSRWDQERKATGPSTATMSDEDMQKVLRELCRAYARNDRHQIAALELLATEIGEELNKRGGMREMGRLFESLGAPEGSRTLEMHWNGIGDWRG